MSNYTKTTNFGAKDTLPSGDSQKIVRGTEFDTEFNNIVTAISSKLDSADLGNTTDPLKGATLVALLRTTGPVGYGPNVTLGYHGNEIASDVGSAAILGGGQAGFNNVIGGNDFSTVNTSTPNEAASGTDANYSVVGGYDNIAGGLASVIFSFHSYTHNNSTHGTISGGSVQKIEAGDYGTIGGGRLNGIYALRNDGITAVTPNHSTIGGGYGNEMRNANATIGGGLYNVLDGDSATLSGGQSNLAEGNFTVVAGGGNNQARLGSAGAGQRNVIGGGRYNIIDSQTNCEASTISGGQNNEVYGSASTIGGGDNNVIGATASANVNYGVIAGGLDNVNPSGTSGVVSGGRGNSVSADYSAITGGRENTATVTYARAGGYQASARHQGGDTYAYGYFASVGDSQTSVVVRKIETTNATQAAMQTIVLPNDSTFVFSALIVARRTDADNESAGYKIEGVIDRNANAASTALVGTITKTVLAEDTAAWDATIEAETSSGGISIKVTGEAAKTVRWVCRLELSEVSG